MQFRVLGPLHVTDGDRVLPLGGQKQRAVLALLTLHGNAVVSAGALAQAVWGLEAPTRSTEILHVYVANLRRVLEPDRSRGSPSRRLVRVDAGYRLCLGDDELDLWAYERLANEGRAAVREGRAREARALLRQALDVWRGEAFPDLADGPCPPVELTALKDSALTVLEDRIEADLAVGEHTGLLPELQALVAQHPLRERLRGQLMLLLYREGRQADALDVFRRGKEVLLEELGLDPGPDLRRLQQDVLRQDARLDQSKGPTYRCSGPVAQPSALIGRQRELADVLALLRDTPTRLVTLLGPGGTGKTRVAFEVAQIMSDDVPDSVAVVPLAPVTDARLVLPTIMAALDLREEPGRAPLQVLAHAMAGQHVLLVLDNFEHLTQAAVDVAALLAAAPTLKVLVTSRAALRVAGEQEYAVPPLPLPALDPLPPLEDLKKNEAVALFLARALAIAPRMTVSEREAPALAAICQRLDGLPLALELAAARCRVLPLPALLERLSDRLGLLVSGPRDAPARQRTLRATIKWSVDLLHAEEHQLLMRLAVFSHGCSLDAAERVCQHGLSIDVLDGLESLTAKSLLQTECGADDELRFVMLETIHSFARELLTASPQQAELRRLHAEYYTQVAETAAVELMASDQALWLRRLQAETGNLRSALSWTTGQGPPPELALRMTGGLWHYWEMSGHLTEGAEWLAAALALSPRSPDLRLPALTGAGTLAWLQGRHGDALRLHGQALDMARELADVQAEAFALNAVGAQYLELGDYSRAEEVLAEAVLRAHKAEDPRTVAFAEHNLADIARLRHDYAGALRLYEAGLDVFRRLGDEWAVAAQLHVLGITALRLGDLRRAESALRESVTISWRTGDRNRLVECLEAFAQLTGQHRDPRQAGQLLGAAARLRRTLGLPMPPPDRQAHDQRLRELRDEVLGSSAFDEAFATGQRLGLEDVIVVALSY